MLKRLNRAQLDAVTTLTGPLLVLAGAGTGKTRVVTFRVAQLVRHGIPPSRILAVTFTNKAAREMRERIGQLLGARLKERPEVSTFHSLAVRILRRHSTQLGYPQRFSIYDYSDQHSVARDALREIQVATAMLRPADLLALIGHWKSRGVWPSEASGSAASDREHLAAVAYRRYQDTLKSRGAVDFDDLLLLTNRLFGRFPDVGRQEAGRFDHVLVDEYQDTNSGQYQIVKTLAVPHRNLCVVGDDDQSIYGWRGADVQHILRFQRDWSDAHVVRLEENYRSTAEILEVANRLISFNKQRFGKCLKAVRRGGERPQVHQYPNETTEAVETVADIVRHLRQPGLEPRDFALLFRTNEQPRVFEAELRKARVPYVLVGGTSFFDRREVRDILAYLRVLASPHDDTSLLRVINVPPRGIGTKSVTRLVEDAVRSKKPVWEQLHRVRNTSDLGPACAESINRFTKMIQGFRGQLGGSPLVDMARSLIEQIGYREELARVYTDREQQEKRWVAVEEVVNALGAYEQGAKREASLHDFLDEVALGERDDGNSKQKELERNAVVLMTLHSAKGLEFPHVYLVGMEEGLLPHHRSVKEDGSAIDEERRLCYVGVTRAQERLTLSMAQTRMKWGKPRPCQPSRFLYELTGQADHPHARPVTARKSVRRRKRRT